MSNDSYMDAPFQNEEEELQIIKLIRDELSRARRKFPEWPAFSVHAAAIVCEESGELIRAALQHSDESGSIIDCDKEAIQTAAMCIRFLLRR